MDSNLRLCEQQASNKMQVFAAQTIISLKFNLKRCNKVFFIVSQAFAALLSDVLSSEMKKK
jgi:hypothetical protein